MFSSALQQSERPNKLVQVEARRPRSVGVEGGVKSLGVFKQHDHGDEGIQSDLASPVKVVGLAQRVE